MSDHKKSILSLLAALAVVLVGLFLVCAQQRGTLNQGDNIASEDEQFKQELLQMLDLTDASDDSTLAAELFQAQEAEADSSEDALFAEQSTAKQEQKQEQGQEQGKESGDDVLALLVPSEQAAQEPVEATPTTTAENMGVTEDMFSKINSDLERLERLLEQRSAAVDSLKNIIEARNSRLQELEARMAKRPASTSQKNEVAKARSASTANRPVPPSSRSGFAAAYQNARSLFERADYRNAIEAFKGVLNAFPEDKEADNCQYWIGECYYGLREYQQAIIEFQKVFAYKQTDKHDDAQLMIGLSYTKNGQKEKAHTEFETFLNNYAGSEYARVAERYYKNI